MEINIFNGSNFLLVSYGTLLVLLSIQLYYILFIYGKLAIRKVKNYQDVQAKKPVSIIICAHNEQENLKLYLPTILEQQYPDFQVVVVNDCSDDETKWILKDFSEQYSHLKIVEIKEHIKLKHSKKFALTMGIKAASHDCLLMTDADCQPSSPLWLDQMASAMGAEKEIVLGYSPYFKFPGFLNKLIRFETTHTAMSFFSYALKKNAYMGVGRNLAYSKALFFKGKGFNAHMHIKSGDDDLFVNSNATRKNVQIALHPDSFVYSMPKQSWKSYYKQKARHAGASVVYKKKHQFSLGLQLISAVFFYMGLIFCAVFFPSFWVITLSAYLLRLLSQLLIYWPIYKKLAVKDLLLWLPVLDLYYYFYICFNGLFNRSKKQHTWK